VRAAYDWAYQTGSPERFGPEQWGDLGALLDGATAGIITAPSPMGNPDSALRVTLGTALARWKLESEPQLPLTVQELAHLAQMNEAAARNSLVETGIKAKGGIDNGTARRWLAERQKFVPTREELLTVESG